MNKHLLLWFMLIAACFSAQTYCQPEFSDGCDLGDQIQSFTIPAANFSHLNTGCSQNSYGNFTSQTINLNAGVNYSFSITHGFNDQYVKIWIDFNNDGVFNDSTPELVASAVSTTTSNGDVTDGAISIPLSVLPGVYRMRVTDRFGELPLACNTDGFGEVHDYTVSIGAAPTCVAPTNLTVSNLTSSSAVVSWLPSSNVAPLGYEYYLSTGSAIPAISAQATGNAPAGSVSVNLSLAASTAYYLWMRSVCSSSTKSTWSGVLVFTTPCSAIIPNYTNYFNTFPGNCWQQASDGNLSTGAVGSDIYWVEDGFLNVSYTGAAKINLFGQNRIGWLKSPAFNLSAGGFRVKFDYGLTAFGTGAGSVMGSDDIIQFAVSDDGGSTWSAIQTWNAANSPSNTTNQFVYNLTSNFSQNTVFAFYASDGSVIDSQDYDFFVDNFTVEQFGSLSATENLKKENKISIYPNPASDYLIISRVDYVQSLQILDFSGRNVKIIENPLSKIDISDLTEGNYMILIKGKDKKTESIKFIKR